jgi:hypothetical protein
MADSQWTDKVRKRLARKNDTAGGVSEIKLSLRKPYGVTVCGIWTAPRAIKQPAGRPRSKTLLVTTLGFAILAWILVSFILNHSAQTNSVSLQKHNQSTFGVIDRG